MLGAFFVESLEFSRYRIILSAERNSFIFFSYLDASYLGLLLDVLAGTSSTLLNRNSGSVLALF